MDQGAGASARDADGTSAIDHVARDWFDIALDAASLRQHAATVAGWRKGMRGTASGIVLEAEPASFQKVLASAAPPHTPGEATRPHRTTDRGADDLLSLGLTEIADLIARRRVSSVEVTQAALARLDAVQAACKAIVDVDHEGSLAAARRADEAIADGAGKPLLGVPLAHKDLFYRAGRPANCGAKRRAGHLPAVTATVLRRLDEAGALDLARLHMTEFAFDPTGNNGHYGACRNPWDLGRLPGGSSSGSGAVVAARAVFGALGTDTGGSIRIPAALCGITGLKPTYGRVSRAGGMPLSFTNDHVGPMARSARDCARLLTALAGFDPQDPTSSREPVGDYEDALTRSVAGLRIGVPQAFFRSGVPAGMAAVLDASIRVFEGLGASIREVPDFDYAELNMLGAIVTRAEAAAAHVNWLREYPDEYSPAVREKFEEGLAIPASTYVQALATRGPRLRQFLDTVLRDVDMLHAPVAPIVAPRLDLTLGSQDEMRRVMADLTILMRPINFLGLPAISVPCGFVREDGVDLPTAFQLIGRPFAETDLLRAANAYQQQTDWHERRPSI